VCDCCYFAILFAMLFLLLFFDGPLWTVDCHELPLLASWLRWFYHEFVRVPRLYPAVPPANPWFMPARRLHRSVWRAAWCSPSSRAAYRLKR